MTNERPFKCSTVQKFNVAGGNLERLNSAEGAVERTRSGVSKKIQLLCSRPAKMFGRELGPALGDAGLLTRELE